jgi:hypothetical protein
MACINKKSPKSQMYASVHIHTRPTYTRVLSLIDAGKLQKATSSTRMKTTSNQKIENRKNTHASAPVSASGTDARRALDLVIVR